MFFHNNNQWCSFNPAAVYALWYVNRNSITTPTNILASTSAYNNSQIPIDHIIAPMIGAVLAGLLCNYYFPDNPACWKRNAARFK